MEQCAEGVPFVPCRAMGARRAFATLILDDRAAFGKQISDMSDGGICVGLPSQTPFRGSLRSPHHGVLDGTASLPEMGERILDLLLRIASGEKSKSEELGLGRHEFAPWQIGITG